MNDIRVDASRRELWLRRGARWTRRSDLTVRELQLLQRLLDGAGRVVARADLLEAVWGDASDAVRPGVVDKHVAALRRKLGALGARIKSAYGAGYAWVSSAGTTRGTSSRRSGAAPRRG